MPHLIRLTETDGFEKEAPAPQAKISPPAGSNGLGWKRIAAAQPSTYYGQLALERLGRPLIPDRNPSPEATGGARDAVWNLYVVRVDGTGLIQLTDGDTDAGAPCWGHDGWIYFHSNQAGSYDIWRLHPTGELEAMGMAPKR